MIKGEISRTLKAFKRRRRASLKPRFKIPPQPPRANPNPCGLADDLGIGEEQQCGMDIVARWWKLRLVHP